MASSRAGAWSDALRDAEAALDSAPDISITHERAGAGILSKQLRQDVMNATRAPNSNFYNTKNAIFVNLITSCCF